MKIKKNNKLSKKLFVLTIFLICSHHKNFAQSLDFLTDLGLKNSPQLKKQVHQMNASKEIFLGQSVFVENPTLGLSYQNIPISTWPSFDKHMMSGVDISFSQKLAFPWVDQYRKNAFYQEYLSEKEKTKDDRKHLVRNIKIVFHTLHFFLTQKKNLLENSITLMDIAKVARSLVSINKMHSSQVLTIEADIAILKNQILQVEASIKQAQVNMENLCGAKIEWTKNKMNDWLVKSEYIVFPENFRVEEHPFYKNVQFQVESEKVKEAKEKAKLFPDITLQANYRLRKEVVNKDVGEDFISLKASMTLPFYYLLKEKHSILAQESIKKSIIEQAKWVKLMLENNWSGESVKSKKLFQAYQNFEKEVLPKYKASYQANLGSFSSGAVTLLDVLDAYRKYLDVSIQQAELFRELQISIANLNYLRSQYDEKK